MSFRLLVAPLTVLACLFLPVSSAFALCNGLEPTIVGTDPGGETLTGTTGDDVIQAGDGNDQITGLGGNDVICDGGGNDTVDGGDGNDVLVDGSGDDSYTGGDGLDSVDFSAAASGIYAAIGSSANGTTIGSDIEGLMGSAHNDTLVGSTGNNHLDGRDGDDLLAGYAGDDTLVGGDGDDTFQGDEGTDVYVGGSGADRVDYGSASAGVLVTIGAGADDGVASEGENVPADIENVDGSPFDDALTGSDGSNVLGGNGGSDVLDGGDGDDTLNGGDGDDTLMWGPGADRMNGADGRDIADYSDAPASVSVAPWNSPTSGMEGEGDTVATDVEDIMGSAYADTLEGYDYDSRLYGGGGDDQLSGNGGNDELFGGPGNDTANGGMGHDRFYDVEEGIGGWGLDWLSASTSEASHQGSASNDILFSSVATSQAHVLAGGDENDIVIGKADVGGSAYIYGNDGDDILVGMSEAPVDGGAGSDTCYTIVPLLAANCESVVELSDTNLTVPTHALTTAPVEGSTVTTSRVTVEFATTDAGASYCMIDSGAIADCSAGTFTSGHLRNGAHALAVVTLAEGNADPVITVRRFNVDAPKPQSITNVQAGTRWVSFDTDALGGVWMVKFEVDDGEPNTYSANIESPRITHENISGGVRVRFEFANTTDADIQSIELLQLDGSDSLVWTGSGITMTTDFAMWDGLGTTDASWAGGNELRSATWAWTEGVPRGLSLWEACVTTPASDDCAEGNRIGEITNASGSQSFVYVSVNDTAASGDVRRICVTLRDTYYVTYHPVCTDGVVIDADAPSPPETVGEGIGTGEGSDSDWSSVPFPVSSWTASTDTTTSIVAYEWCFTNAASETQCDPVSSAGTGSTTDRWVLFPPDLLMTEDGGTYYWCIRAVDSVGNRSDYTCSDGLQVDGVPPTPTELITEDGAYLGLGPTVRLEWEPAFDAESGISDYQVAYAPVGELFSSAQLVAVTSDTYVDVEVDPNLTYEWIVYARDMAPNTSWSEVRTFRTEVAPEPSIIDVQQGLRHLSFETGTMTGVETIRVEVSNEGSGPFEFPIGDANVTRMALEDEAERVRIDLPNTTMLHVTGIKLLDGAGDPVATWNGNLDTDFQIWDGSTEADVDALGAGVSELSASWRWNESAGVPASVYGWTVCVADSGTSDCDDSHVIGTPVEISSSESTASVTLPAALQHGDQRFVCAVVRDSAGNRYQSACTDGVTVDAEAPSASDSVNDGIASGGIDVDWLTTTDRLDGFWSSVSDATSYDLCITTTPASTTCDPVVPNASANTPGLTASVTDLDLSSSEATYYTCVRSVDDIGNHSDWVCSDGVQIDVDAPSVPVPATENGAPVGAGPLIALNWNESTDTRSGVAEYSFRVAPVGDIESASWNSTVGTTGTYPLGVAGEYEWQVRSVDVAGNVSEASVLRTFTVSSARGVSNVAGGVDSISFDIDDPTGIKQIDMDLGGRAFDWPLISDQVDVEQLSGDAIRVTVRLPLPTDITATRIALRTTDGLPAGEWTGSELVDSSYELVDGTTSGSDIEWTTPGADMYVRWRWASDPVPDVNPDTGFAAAHACISTVSTSSCGPDERIGEISYVGGWYARSVWLPNTELLSHGDVRYVCLYMRDIENNTYPATCTSGVQVDQAPPSSPVVVRDGATGDDIDWTKNQTQVDFAHSGASDVGSGISGHMVCVTQNPILLPCVAIPQVTESFVSENPGALPVFSPLDEGTWYWTCLRTADMVGHYAITATCSDGFKVDAGQPTMPEPIAPADDAVLWQDGDNAISWDPASDLVSGLDGYEYRIAPQGEIESAIWVATPLTWQEVNAEPGTYEWQVRSYDVAGNRSNESPVRSFDVITSPTITQSGSLGERLPFDVSDMSVVASIDVQAGNWNWTWEIGDDQVEVQPGDGSAAHIEIYMPILDVMHVDQITLRDASGVRLARWNGDAQLTPNFRIRNGYSPYGPENAWSDALTQDRAAAWQWVSGQNSALGEWSACVSLAADVSCDGSERLGEIVAVDPEATHVVLNPTDSPAHLDQRFVCLTAVRDVAGNDFPGVCTNALTIDAVGPSLPERVWEGDDELDVDWVGSGAFTSQWSQLIDSGSGVRWVSWCVSADPESPTCAPGLPWGDLAFAPTSHQISTSAMTEEDGPYYVCVWGYDAANNITNGRVCSDGVQYDETAPPAPELLAPADEGSVETINDTVELEWQVATDARSGLSHYEYRFAPEGFLAGVAWHATTSTSATPFVTISGTYEWQVRAVDLVGNIAASAIRTVDIHAPALMLSSPLVFDGNGSGTDDVDWIDPTDEDISIDAHWAAATVPLEWCATVTETCGPDALQPWTAVATDQSTAVLGDPTTLGVPGSVYRFCLRASSITGQLEHPTCTDGQTVADSAPTMGPVTDGAASTDARYVVVDEPLEASWAPASFDFVPVQEYEWRICDAAHTCDTPIASGSTSETTAAVTMTQSLGTVVKTCVVAVDQADRSSAEVCSDGMTVVAAADSPINPTFVGYRDAARGVQVPFVVNGEKTTISWADDSDFGGPSTTEWEICKDEPCSGVPPYGDVFASGTAHDSFVSLDLIYPEPALNTADTYWMCSDRVGSDCTAYTVIQSPSGSRTTSGDIRDNVGGFLSYNDIDAVPMDRGATVRWAPSYSTDVWELCPTIDCSQTIARGMTAAGFVRLRNELSPGATYVLCVTQYYGAGAGVYPPRCSDGFTVATVSGTQVGNPDAYESYHYVDEDDHWTVEHSPYIVNGPITVGGSSGTPVDLRIDPGVVVKFAHDGGIRVASGSRIFIDGTTATPVIFERLDPERGWVGGLRLTGAGSRLSGLHMSGFATYEDGFVNGLTVDPSASGTTIIDSEFDASGSVFRGGFNSVISIASPHTLVSRVSAGHGGVGISVASNPGVRVEDSEFHHNYRGMTTSGGPLGEGQAVITRNSFHGNTGWVAKSIVAHLEDLQGNVERIPQVFNNSFDQRGADLYVYGYPPVLPWLDNAWTSTQVTYCVRFHRISGIPDTRWGGAAQLSVYSEPGAYSPTALANPQDPSPPWPCPENNDPSYYDWQYSGRDPFRVVSSGHGDGKAFGSGINSADPTGLQGDPVNSQSGRFVHKRRDLVLAGIDEVFDTERTFNGLSAAGSGPNVLGPGWSTVLDTRVEASGDQIHLFDRRGGVATYERDQLSDTWTSIAGSWGKVETDQTVGHELTRFKATSRNGETWTFNAGGRLTSFRDRSGNGFSVIDVGSVSGSGSYSEDTVVLLSTGTKVNLTFDPQTGRMIRMAVDDGRAVEYSYDPQAGFRLEGVDGPSGRSWSYGFDERMRLACEMNASGTLVFENLYDSEGRVTHQWDATKGECDYGFVDLSEAPQPTRWFYSEHSDGTQTTIARDPALAEWSDVYDAEGRMVARIDPTDRCTSFSYDASDNRTFEVRGDGRVIRSTYDDHGRATTRSTELITGTTPWNCPGSRPVPAPTELDEPFTETFEYGPDGSVISSEQRYHGQLDASQRTVNEWHDGSLRQTTVYPDQNDPDPADPLVTEYDRDSRGLITAETDPRGNTWHRTWNARGLLVSETPPGRGRTDFVYDERGFLESVTDPLRSGHVRRSQAKYDHNDMGQVTSATDAYGRTSTITYHATGSIDRTTDVDDQVTEYTNNDFDEPEAIEGPTETKHLTYDERGLVTKITADIGDSSPLEVTAYTHDLAGRLQTVVDPGGHDPETNEPISGRATTITYDEAGRPARIDKPGNRRETMTYDAVDRVIGVVAASVDGTQVTSIDRRETIYNDAEGTVDSSQVSVVDGSKLTTTTIGDGFGRAIETIDPRLQSWKLRRDATGNVVQTTSPLGHVAKMTYAADGQLETSLAPGAFADPADPSATLADLGEASPSSLSKYRTEFEYNAAGELIEQVQNGRDMRFDRDRMGRVWRQTDASGDATSWSFDTFGRIDAVTGPDGNTLSRDYQDGGAKLVETDPRGNVWTKTFDARGRLLSEKHPDNAQWNHQYDAEGRLIATVDPASRTTSRAYDAIGRQQSLSYSADPSQNASWAYDDAQRKVVLTDDTGVQTRTADGFGRLLTDVRAGHHAISYAWDDAGNKVAMSVAGGGTTNWTYDDDGRQSAVTHGGASTVFGYGAAGTLDRIERASAVGTESLVESRAYDEFGAVTDLTRRVGVAVREELSVDRDAVGRVSRIDRLDGSADRYRYAGARLVSECHSTDCSDDSQDWTKYHYDANGNRTKSVTSSGTTEFAHDEADRLATRTKPGHSPVAFSYDASGNLLNDGEHRFWRAQSGRMIGVGATDASTPSTSYVYDGNGTRISTLAPGSTLNSVWDSTGGIPQVAAEFNGSGDLLRTNVRGAAGLDRVLTPGGTHYAGLSPVVGSVEQMFDVEGNIESQQRFDAWGQTTTSTGSLPTPLGYAGEAFDASSGTYHLRARDYNPRTATFGGIDPVQRSSSQRWNGTYNYAEGNPALYTDPLGTCSICSDLWDNTKGLAVGVVGNAVEGAKGVYNMCQAGNTAVKMVGLSCVVGAGQALGNSAAVLYACGATTRPNDASAMAQCAARKAEEALKSCWRDIQVGGEYAGRGCVGDLMLGAGAGKAVKVVARGSKNSRLGGSCRTGHSFAGTTRVLMADGSWRPIESIRIGDEVMARDPNSGERVARRVDATLKHVDRSNYVKITAAGGFVVGTGHHPFWNDTIKKWQRADTLGSAARLLASNGDRNQVAVTQTSPTAGHVVYNLTITQAHNYYIQIGSSNALVHNTDCDPGRGMHGDMGGAARGIEASEVIANPSRVFAQSDGQMVYVAQRADGSYDVVVRDPSAPAGVNTSVHNRPASQVQGKIDSGEWDDVW